MKYSLIDEDLPKIFDYDLLLNYARYNGNIHSLYYEPIPGVKFEKFHSVKIECFENLLTVDISLFGILNWKIILGLKEKITFQSYNNKVVDRVVCVLDFENLDKRKMIFVERDVDNKEYMWENVNM